MTHMGLQPFRIVGMNFSGKAPLPPFIETDAKVIEPNSVHMELFAVGTENRHKLRREVQHLPELNFTSAQFLLCSFTLSDVDYSSCVFDEIARGTENRMTNAVNVPNGTTRMHNAIIQFFVYLFMLGPLHRFPERRSIVGMNSLDEFFGSRETILWIKTQNAVAFIRTMVDVAVETPCPASRVAEFLRLGKISLALTQLLLHARVLEEQLQIKLRVQHRRFGKEDEQDRDRG